MYLVIYFALIAVLAGTAFIILNESSRYNETFIMELLLGVTTVSYFGLFISAIAIAQVGQMR